MDATLAEAGSVAPSPPRRRLPRPLRAAVTFVLIAVALAVLWEGYKLVGKAAGITNPVRPDDKSMPHVWDIVGALFQPARRGGEDILLVILLKAAWFTWKEAAVGFVAGSLLGFGLGVAFTRSSLLERGLMPYVVGSQTVPLLAVAPMVVIWASRRDLPPWTAVATIAAYLTFFPVTINTLRGLRSPEATAVELMRSYGASPGEVLRKLRIPAALPYLFTALKVSATASVIGAIIGELPAGMQEGLGRALLTFSYYYISGPEKLFASLIVASAVGIFFVTLVALAERLLVPPDRRLVQ